MLPKIETNKNNDNDIKIQTEYSLYFDGCSKSNPGKSGIGYVIYKNGEEIWSECKYIGIKTNNEAEYSALILGLETALQLDIKDITICGDSLLVINQLTNKYKVKSEKLFDLHDKAKELAKQFNYIEFIHVYRKDNKRADYLSNLALKQMNVICEDNIIKL